jgi:tRNA pseudouridine32 synthase / 23S rRNA pseudouridine746 synthase
MLVRMDDLKLLHADAHLLVVDKPAGLLAVPGRGEGERLNLTVQLRVLHPEALIVHRLDQATSGLMVFARNAAVQRALSMAFEARQVHKRYQAVVRGDVHGETGTIDAPLVADWPRRPRQMVDLERGKPSCTHWRVIERLFGNTRLELEPVTGRSHQLRVHLQSIGHPIVGDTLYGEGPPSAQRLLLHATRLELTHPCTGQVLVFASEAPF